MFAIVDAEMSRIPSAPPRRRFSRPAATAGGLVFSESTDSSLLTADLQVLLASARDMPGYL
jgi:hypothetical protein